MEAMLTNGEDLTQTPRIKVSTIHGAKGGEAISFGSFFKSNN